MPFSAKFWLIFGVATIISLIVTPISIKLAPKLGIMDIPEDSRRVHQKPIPRFAGSAIFLGVGVAVLLILLCFNDDIQIFVTVHPQMAAKTLIVSVFIYIMGLVDDVISLKAWIKLIVQAACAAMLYLFGIKVQMEGFFGGIAGNPAAEVISFIITVIWVVAITNIINLVDGVDGLAAGIVIISAFAISYIGYIHGYYLVCLMMLAVAGASIGFLPYNFYPAKTFMGDQGSQFLGFCLAAFSLIQPLKSATVFTLLIPILTLGIPIVDTLFAVFRRVINKKPVMEADKGHIHHRLLRAGIGQRRTVLILYGISAVMGIASILYSRGPNLYRESFALIVISLVFVYVVLTDMNHWAPKIREEKNDNNDTENCKEFDLKKAGNSENDSDDSTAGNIMKAARMDTFDDIDKMH